MYVGHTAVALTLKARYPRVPLLSLLIACYGPDCIEVLARDPFRGLVSYVTHSVPGVVYAATVAALLCRFAPATKVASTPVFVAWLLHWPADFVTGKKPLFTLTSSVGLGLYDHPAIDMATEGTFVLVACVLYARVFATRRQHRLLVVALASALLALQMSMLFVRGRTQGFASAAGDGASRIASSVGH